MTCKHNRQTGLWALRCDDCGRLIEQLTGNNQRPNLLEQLREAEQIISRAAWCPNTSWTQDMWNSRVSKFVTNVGGLINCTDVKVEP
jgi:hypothetical protein